MNKYDYRGKTIFVGIDVHKKTYMVVCLCDHIVVKRDTIPAYPKQLLAYLNKFFKGAHIYSAYEAGFSGLGLHRFLQENEVHNLVINAASIEIGARDRVKTDKRDALKIAVQLSAHRLGSIFIPTRTMEDHRELTRARAILVKDRNRISIRMKGKANYYGLLGPEDNQRVCKKWIENLLLQPTEPCLKRTLQLFADQWNYLSEQIKEFDELLREQGLQDSKREAIYRSVPGIGPTAARTLANELGDMSQFSSERKLFSYLGLTPSEYSSGGYVRRGHISRQGKPILRSILVQSSWVAIRYDKSLREIYERIAKRAGGKRAIVAVARRLAGRIRSCFCSGCEYKFELLEQKNAA